MVRHDPMQTLQERAEQATREALQRLSELISACRESESRLGMLQRYRDEYRAKLEAATRKGVSALELANFRNFLAKLDEAIAQQRADVAHRQAAVMRGRADWQEAERRARSYEVLLERRAEAARTHALRAEQKQTDEYAARLAAAAPRRI